MRLAEYDLGGALCVLRRHFHGGVPNVNAVPSPRWNARLFEHIDHVGLPLAALTRLEEADRVDAVLECVFHHEQSLHGLGIVVKRYL